MTDNLTARLFKGIAEEIERLASSPAARDLKIFTARIKLSRIHRAYRARRH